MKKQSTTQADQQRKLERRMQRMERLGFITRKCVVIRERKFYGPRSEYSLVANETREIIFQSREAAQAALDHEEEEIRRGYGAYMCANNESGSPDFVIANVNQSRAKRLLAAAQEVN